MIIDFKLPKKDKGLIAKIMERVRRELDVASFQSTEMDLVACHKYDTKLDLEAMLTASAADFGHDVHGISRYIDRSTGKLTDHFCPRLVLRKKKTVTCKFCRKRTPRSTAHRHDGGWVGDQCCWDERLKSTE